MNNNESSDEKDSSDGEVIPNCVTHNITRKISTESKNTCET